MIELYPTYEQKEFAYNLTCNGEFGKRGKGDGTVDQQFCGMLVQIVFGDLFDYKRPEKKSSWDGGYDFIMTHEGKQYKADIKARGSHYDMQPHYVHNFIGYQKDYNCDLYIFANYNVDKDKIQICGAVSKYELLTKAKFYKKGDTRTRDDGTTFVAKAPLFELEQYKIHEMYNEYEIFDVLEMELKRRTHCEELKQQLKEIPKIERELDKTDKLGYFRTLYGILGWKPNIQQLIFVFRQAYKKSKATDEQLCEYFSVRKNETDLVELVNYYLYKEEQEIERQREKESKNEELTKII